MRQQTTTSGETADAPIVDNVSGQAELKIYLQTCARNCLEHGASVREAIKVCRECGIEESTINQWLSEVGWAESTVASVMSSERVASGVRMRAIGGGRKMQAGKRDVVQCVIDCALRLTDTEIEATAAVRSALRQLEKQTKATNQPTE